MDADPARTHPGAPLATVPSPSGPARSWRRAPRAFGHAEVFAALFAVAFVAARTLPLLDLPYDCPFRALIGIPCATCGMTHAFVHLAQGAVRAAVLASPFGALLAAAAWGFAALDAVRLALALPLPRPSPRLARVLIVAALIGCLANWAFLVIADRA